MTRARTARAALAAPALALSLAACALPDAGGGTPEIATTGTAQGRVGTWHFRNEPDADIPCSLIYIDPETRIVATHALAGGSAAALVLFPVRGAALSPASRGNQAGEWQGGGQSLPLRLRRFQRTNLGAELDGRERALLAGRSTLVVKEADGSTRLRIALPAVDAGTLRAYAACGRGGVASPAKVGAQALPAKAGPAAK